MRPYGQKFLYVLLHSREKVALLRDIPTGIENQAVERFTRSKIAAVAIGVHSCIFLISKHLLAFKRLTYLDSTSTSENNEINMIP